VHEAERAADAAAPQGLELLASHEPAGLWLRLAPGTALVESPHPVARIWLAHRSDAPNRFAPVREAFAAGRGDSVRVARQGWRATVAVIEAAELRYTAAVLAGRPLDTALSEAGDGFDFEAWLIAALQQQRLSAVSTTPPSA
jgi:hypothetical protein